MTSYSETKYKRGFYRSRHGVFFGVCRGIAEHFDFSVFWMRMLWLLSGLFLISIPLLLIAYIVLAILMKPEPVVPFESDADREFYSSYITSRELAVDRLRRECDTMERRIQRMESIVTAPEFDWERRISAKTE